jgi:hypothetical protein
MSFAQVIQVNGVSPATDFYGLIARIHPKHKPAYSKNLHRWLKTHGRPGDTVYRVSSGSKLSRVFGGGAIFIGQPYGDYEGDSDFSGAPLMQVLCMGRSAVRACYASGAVCLVEIADFWDRYEQVGRCAIDPQHAIHFRDNDLRVHLVDGQQFCKWCAAQLANS